MIVKELQAHDYQLQLEDEGYAVTRDGERYDFIPFDIIRIFVDEQMLLESYLDGAYVYQTDNMPPEVHDV